MTRAFHPRSRTDGLPNGPPLHRPETAGHHLVRRVPVAGAEDTVAAVLAALPGHTYDAAEAVYVLDEQERLQGMVRLRELLAAPGERKLGELMDLRPPKVHAGEDQERMAVLAIRHGVAAVPVVDGPGRLLGVVPASALIQILRREHVEDLHRLAGIRAGQAQAHEAIAASPLHRLRDRLPWLLVGLLGSTVATLVMARFERVLEARVAVAFFVPAIVYLADAIGTQTEAIAVRFLTLSHAPLGRLLLGELAAGLLIGLSLGALIYPAVWLGFGDSGLAFAVTLAVVAAGGCAASIGLVFPWLLSWAGKDPAYGSGPIATIIQDVLSLLIYFWIALRLVV
jgi:magnesium transporter